MRSLSYADGSANLYRLEQTADDAEVRFEYVPVTRERSSTGLYDGGPPRHEQVPADDPRLAEVWRRVDELEADTARHAAGRAKGTGAFTVTTSAGTRSFIVERGPALAELESVLARLGQGV